MTSSPLRDPPAACRLLDLTDLPDLASTTSHQVLILDLHYQPTATQACPCLDQWEESLGLDLPTDMHSYRGRALDLCLILGVRHRHTSVPLRLTLDRCLCHLVSVDLWDHVHPSLLTCATWDRGITPAHQ